MICYQTTSGIAGFNETSRLFSRRYAEDKIATCYWNELLYLMGLYHSLMRLNNSYARMMIRVFSMFNQCHFRNDYFLKIIEAGIISNTDHYDIQSSKGNIQCWQNNFHAAFILLKIIAFVPLLTYQLNITPDAWAVENIALIKKADSNGRGR